MKRFEILEKKTVNLSFNSSCLVLAVEPEVERKHRGRGAPKVADVYRPAARSGNGKNTCNTHMHDDLP